jgi:hypothetical protein
MTIDLITLALQARQRRFSHARVVAALGEHTSNVADTIVVFGGWGNLDAGQPLEPGGSVVTGTTLLLDRLNELRNESLRPLRIASYHGTMDALNHDPISHSSFHFIWDNFHPLGKLIIYGYSFGAFDAMMLTNVFTMSLPYYNANRHTFERYFPPSPDRRADIYGFVRVDLLVTIDAASGPLSDFAARTVLPSVRTNLNIYQTEPAGSRELFGFRLGARSHGERCEPMDPNVTEVQNIDWTYKYASDPGAGHGMIDNDSIDEVIRAIRGELLA